MKNLRLAILMSLISSGSICFGQRMETTSDTLIVLDNDYQFHIQKSKKNKTAAWVALGGGAGLVILGAAINFDKTFCNLDCPDNINSNEGLWPAYIGGAAMVASVPLFIAARKHNKEAQSMLSITPTVYLNKRQQAGGFILVFNLD